MKATLYALLTIGSLLAVSPATARATRHTLTESPAEAERKAATAKAAKAEKAATRKSASGSSRKFLKVKKTLHRSLLVVLGLEDSRSVTSPAKLDWQLHVHQKHLQTRARQESRARRLRCQRHLN